MMHFSCSITYPKLVLIPHRLSNTVYALWMHLVFIVPWWEYIIVSYYFWKPPREWLIPHFLFFWFYIHPVTINVIFFIAYSPDSSIETSGLLIKHLISGILIAKEYKKKCTHLEWRKKCQVVIFILLILKKCPPLISPFQCTQTTIISSIGNH